MEWKTRRKAGRTATCNSRRFARRRSISDGTISSRSRGSGRRPQKARANSSPCREATIFRTNRSASSVPSRSPTIRKSAPSSRTRSDRCSPNRAGRRFREIRPRPLRQIGPIRVSPSARALGGSVIGLSLKRGLGYLATDPEDTSVSLVRVLAEAHTPFLWITARALSAPPDGVDLIRVTTLAGAMGTADPRRLQDLRTAATTFFDERRPGALVLDCLDPLIVHSGVVRVLRFVNVLHEDIPVVPGHPEALPRSCGNALAVPDVVLALDVRLGRLGRRHAEDPVPAGRPVASLLKFIRLRRTA